MNTESPTPKEPVDYASKAQFLLDTVDSMSFEMLLKAAQLQLLTEIRDALKNPPLGLCAACTTTIYSTLKDQ